MATSKRKQLSKVDALSSSLDDLEKKLEPLFQQSLSELAAPLETLQKASLHVLLPYLVNDLVFIYLKTRGIDPKAHPVVAELDRVRQYFAKIKEAENSNKKRTAEIDKAAATRFIKHAIAQSQNQSAMSKEVAQPIASSSSEPIPIHVTDKMHEREEYLKRVRDAGEESDDEGLDVIDNAEDGQDGAESDEKGKGKAVSMDAEGLISAAAQHAQTQTSKKKRKSAIDPFGSFGKEQTREGNSGPANKRVAVISGNDTPTSSRASSDTETSKTPRRRKRKKPTGETEDTSD